MPKPSTPVTPERLQAAALRYLERFASSADSLRRVLARRVERSVAEHGTDREQALAWVEAAIGRCRELGAIDDAAYARMKASSLHRRGASVRAIRGTLSEKGIERDEAEQALAELDDDAEGDLDRRAALALARRRRIGPFRRPETRAGFRSKDLATLARAGFTYETARAVIDSEPDDAGVAPEALG